MTTEALDARRQGIVTISAFAANGDLERLEPALDEGLDAGLAVNEIKESWSSSTPTPGFPAA